MPGFNYLFERRSLTLFAINASYNVVAFTAMGAIIGALQQRQRRRGGIGPAFSAPRG
ncbi:MAG TPA: DUF1761 domain-containing protein [Arthrobacter sp.]